MTSNIIYHNFANTNIIVDYSATNTPSFAKASRIIKATRRMNKALNAVCTFLCGTCVGISLVILLNLWTAL